MGLTKHIIMHPAINTLRSSVSQAVSVQFGLFPRTFATGVVHRSSDSFKVQDPKDFNDRVKNSKVPVIVDFFATWCNPCRMLTPRLESVIAENKGKVILAKVDIDENTDLALDYEVGSVPVLMVFRNGKAEDKLVGLQDTDKLRKFVDKAIGSSKETAAINSP